MERALLVQFPFYKDKKNILRNCKKLKETNIFDIQTFFPRDNASS